MEIELRFAVNEVIESRKKGDDVPALRISLAAAALKTVQQQYLQVLKVRIAPLAMRVTVEETES